MMTTQRGERKGGKRVWKEKEIDKGKITRKINWIYKDSQKCKV